MSDIYSAKSWLKSYDASVPASLVYPEKTIVDMFRDTCKSLPGRIAAYYLGAGIKYEQFDNLSDRFANFLRDQGLKKGDVVGLHMPNTPGFLICFLGAQKLGCITHGVSVLLSEKELNYQLNDSGAKVLCTFDALYPRVNQVVKSTKVKSVTVLESSDFLPVVKKSMGKLMKKFPVVNLTPPEGVSVAKLNHILKTYTADPVKIESDPESICLLMYTGGTTGPSKGAMLTNKNVASHITQWKAWFDFNLGEDIALVTFPFFHVGGLFGGILCLLTGTTQIIIPNPRDLNYQINCIKKYRVNRITTVPTTYIELLKNSTFTNGDYSFTKVWTTGGAPFPAEYMKPFNAVIGKTVLEHYGLTETMCLVTANPMYGQKKIGSVGLPLPDTEIKIVDPDTGGLTKPGEPGELCCRGPQIMKGYFNKPEETANAIRESWFHTGDIAVMDEDGYISIIDRIKDMVNVSGMKVFTRELDDVICTHSDVFLAASVGMEDPKRPFTEIVVSAIILKPGIEKSDAEKEKITSYLKEKVAPYKVPKKIVFVDNLPLSPIGKILKRELREILK